MDGVVNVNTQKNEPKLRTVFVYILNCIYRNVRVIFTVLIKLLGYGSEESLV